MKKILVRVSFIGVLLLGGCSSAKNAVDYIDVAFSGVDTKGNAKYNIDYSKLLKDTLNYDEDNDFPDEKTLKKMNELDESFKVSLDTDSELSNGDKVKVNVKVDGNQTKLIKSGEKIFKVTGLKEPIELTSLDVEKYVVVNFTGASGRGRAKIDNKFNKGLDNVKFCIENNGNLSNGDHAKVLIENYNEENLLKNGYVLAKDFSPSVEVSGLDVVAEDPSSIANLADIKSMIDENLDRDFKMGYGSYQFDIKEEKLMYLPFKRNIDSSDFEFFKSNRSGNGNLVKIFTVTVFTDGLDGGRKVISNKTSVVGFSDIILDEKNNANLAELTEIIDTKDDTYSLDSVVQLYEGYGYKEVKN